MFRQLRCGSQKQLLGARNSTKINLRGPPNLNPSRKRPKIHWNHLKLLQRRSQNHTKILNAVQIRPQKIVCDFCNVLGAWGLPKWNHNRKNPQKNLKLLIKQCSKKSHFWTLVFFNFLFAFASGNWGQIKHVSNLFGRCVKLHKTTQNRYQNAIEKTSLKNLAKIDLLPHGPPPTNQNR